MSDEPSDKERHDLETHVLICHERYTAIAEKLGEVKDVMDRMDGHLTKIVYVVVIAFLGGIVNVILRAMGIY